MRYFLFCALLIFNISFAQIPADRILKADELSAYLKADVAKQLSDASQRELLNYLADAYKSRYYFNWSDFKDLFDTYTELFPKQFKKHQKLASYHVSRYSADAQWQLPYTNLLGEQVSAYELRHLARQQKSADMALMHFYSDHQSDNINYFTNQVVSLNNAFVKGDYDDAGNGVYEVYRAGRRIHNWLFCHALYLNDPEYNIEKQRLLIRTFLHHGAELFKRLPLYRPGNHHTKGLVALFEIATLFSDFKDTDNWQQHAIKGLVEHMKREINKDGFQFERSIHYHKGDIENYFRVFQLANRSAVDLPEEFTTRFQKMFDALIIMAQPNKKLPVWQDDTGKPYSKYNEMSDAMYLAKAMFADPRYAYFASDIPPVKYYWLMNQNEMKAEDIKSNAPEILSAELQQTGYYVMRDGWEKNALQMVFSAGLSEIKPDHQHGDMLGVTAYGLGTELLPNYQVAYKYDDFSFWKNSWTKNVAIVDSQLQGREWKPNRGGSGFGKWKILPKPSVLQWIKKDKFDYIAATHDGFDNLNVNYTREVIFVKNHYWLVFDRFISNEQHKYQQIWQGSYDVNSEFEVFKTINENSRFFISQLIADKFKISKSSFRTRSNLVFTIDSDSSYRFITLLYPVNNLEQKPENLLIKDNILTDMNLEIHSDKVLKAGEGYLLLDAVKVNFAKKIIKLDEAAHFYMIIKNEQLEMILINSDKIDYQLSDDKGWVQKKLEWIPGEKKSIVYDKRS